ncbi:hypothetical protein HYH03_014375 [Edaphochlamys debaryana]|uniref:Uncharacterized protein n=1 Tax=Edaphochlamys debaryana TaxID=47281 RepID=A0A836BTL6_9CHLO|nr:hypothetical protein HYH03_014375 [Edaphochlamys debaryana]|eukprot:KAG2487003.1 hypothetical protein HYH03_014375 [Edaphochlamys debaryana]
MRERLLPQRHIKGDTAVFSRAIDLMPFNAYTAIAGLWFMAIYQPEVSLDAVYTKDVRGLHGALLSVVSGMTELPIFGGIANAIVMLFTWKKPDSSRTRAHNVSVALQQTLATLACVVIQAGVPIALLLQWVSEGMDSFDDLFNIPKDVPNWARLELSKALVATYVLYWIHRQDATNTLHLLIIAHHHWLYGGRGVGYFWIVVTTVVLYISAITLTYLVTLGVIGRCATPMDVVLSGAGALFILDVDDVLTMTSEPYFDKVKETMLSYEEQRCSSDEEAAANRYHAVTTAEGEEDEGVIGDEVTDYPLIWLGMLFILALTALWCYFLFRVVWGR